MHLRITTLLVAAAVLLASCGGASEPRPAASGSQDWINATLLDVRSGEQLQLNALVGKVVVIETMAIWCLNCRAQQDQLAIALDELGAGDVIAISLDVDSRESAPDLAAYADERGYDWHFAIASPALSRALAGAFGDIVLSPPSTPKIVIAPDGSSSVTFGHELADELVAKLSDLLP